MIIGKAPFVGIRKLIAFTLVFLLLFDPALSIAEVIKPPSDPVQTANQEKTNIDSDASSKADKSKKHTPEDKQDKKTDPVPTSPSDNRPTSPSDNKNGNELIDFGSDAYASELLATVSSSSTQVGGTISQDTTWTAANSPYVVTSSVTVDSGVKLVIEPGVVVKFDSQLSLTVKGTLVADGTPDSKIVFTSLKDDFYAGDTNGDSTATVPASGDWSQISFSSSATNPVLDNCIVKYGG